MDHPTLAPLQPDLAGIAAKAASTARRMAVIVPCYNEAETVHHLLKHMERLQNVWPASNGLEWVLVDDGSSDPTWSLLQEHLAARPDVRLIRHAHNQGIAAALATGLKHTDAPVVASIDADCTYDPVLVAAMAELLTEGVDMVVASPYHPEGAVEGVPAWRLTLSRLASSLYRCLLHNKLHTYTSCVRVCRRRAVAELPQPHPGFVGIVELLWSLDARGGRILEHPARLTVRRFGQSKMRVTRTIYQHLKLLARIARHRSAFWRKRPTNVISSCP